MAAKSGSNTTKCPHCGERCTAIRTYQITALVREVIYQCRNEHCIFTFAAHIAPIRTIAPSLAPNPNVHIPTQAAANARPAKGAVGELVAAVA